MVCGKFIINKAKSFRILDFFEISLIGNLTDKFLAEYNYPG